MTPEQLSNAVVDALRALVERRELTLPDGVPASVTVERPRQQGHGDYATNVALQLGKKAGVNPRDAGRDGSLPSSRAPLGSPASRWRGRGS